MNILALVTAGVFFLVGLAGTLLPILPGAPLIWAGMLIYGLIAGFEKLSVFFFIGQGVLTAAVMGVDYLATALGSRYFGGSRAALAGAALGMLVGAIFFNIAGLLLGPFVGAFLAELVFGRRPEEALRSGIGATLGSLGGIPVKLFIELVMIAWFILVIIG